MGKIIHSKILPNKKVVCKILLEEDEAFNLKGHLKKVHTFASELCNKDSHISVRGNKGVTKYFRIPLSLRTRKKYHGTLSYQKYETASKVFYIYVINKQDMQKEK